MKWESVKVFRYEMLKCYSGNVFRYGGVRC